MKIGKRAALRLRWEIAENRCPVRPGITHRRVCTGWVEAFDYTRGSDNWLQVVECEKCGAP